MRHDLSRRTFLASAAGGAAGLAVTACGKPVRRVAVGGAEVRQAEAARRKSGAPVRDVDLTAGPATLDLAGTPAETWAYGGAVPGRELRIRAGEVVRARLRNDLPDPTSVHWHGLALRNDMDGVAGLTQQPIAPGTTFTYDFAADVPGTYWFHPHAGLQLDRGLYAPLIVEDPAEPLSYDRELVVVLDDWLVGTTPEKTLEGLKSGGMQMGGMQMGGAGGGSDVGDDPGDVSYDMYLANGRPEADPATLEVRPGERVRLRLVNAGSDTAFRVAVGGHQLKVTHTDGFPVEPVTGDAVLIGMGERYDAIITVAGSGVFPLVALAEGKDGMARANLRSGPGTAPPAATRPSELDGKKRIQANDLRAAPPVALAARRPDRVHQVTLGGPPPGTYRWTINGRAASDEAKLFTDAKPLGVRRGERVRLEFENRSTMFHPMHLHGHTFQVVRPDGSAGPRKDTLLVKPTERLAVEFDAENPGQWLMHCHNLYHQATGMHSVVSYLQ